MRQAAGRLARRLLLFRSGAEIAELAGALRARAYL